MSGVSNLLEVADRMAALRRERDEYLQQATDADDTIVELLFELKYVIGIVERGRGRPLESGESVRTALLNYVKELEAKSREADAK